MRTTWLAWIGTALAVAGPASAHHSFGTFLMNENIELNGVVTKFDYVNPHSWLEFDVKGTDGKTTSYRCEMRSATTLRRSGWTQEMFAAGTKITVQGSPDRTDPHACYVSTLVFADGTTLDRYGQRIEAKPTTQRAARTASGEPNIAGDWAQEQLVMTDPKGLTARSCRCRSRRSSASAACPRASARSRALAARPRRTRRPAGEQAGGALRGRAQRSGQGRDGKLAAMPRAMRSCQQGSILSDWGGEGVNRITQNADTIKLQYGRLGLERTIYMKASAHPTNVAPTRAGHSIGKWENDVLVVDTVGFLPGTLTGTTPHSDRLHVVERFRLDPTTTTLKREYTAEDPAFFTAAYTGSDSLSPSNVPFAVEACEDLTPTAAATR